LHPNPKEGALFDGGFSLDLVSLKVIACRHNLKNSSNVRFQKSKNILVEIYIYFFAIAYRMMCLIPLLLGFFE
jgi:hypothetical protein